MTLNNIIKDTTVSYLKTIDPANPPEPDVIEEELVTLVNNAVKAENDFRIKGEKLKPIQKLSPNQIATIMLHLYNIRRLTFCGLKSDSYYDVLSIYKDSGSDEGIYVKNDDELKRIALKYNYTISKNELNEVLELLKTNAQRVERCTDKDLIAVNNGIFNFKTKTLEPFSPNVVFTAKSKVNYNPFATNVVIHNDEDGTDWDIESWMNDLSDDPEIVQLLWEILSAIIRPHVRWNKSAWFYSETGNNGKGTLCELMRSLCGEGSYASISLNDFSKDFALEPLIHATAIIVDENDVGCFIDKAANLKAVITNDVISINRKFKTPISYQFYGFMVQCLNEFPRIKDKSESFFRRQLFIPFNKCFTGQERRYIKTDYLHRPEVLEYVMYKVLHMNFYQLSEPQACVDVLNEYKEFNDPVRQFWDELSDYFSWNLLPFGFLYDLYKSWYRKNSPNGSIQSKTKFINELLVTIQGDKNWYCLGKNKNIRTSNRMEEPELLIVDYDLRDWMSKTYVGDDRTMLSIPSTNAFYRGLLRRNTVDDNENIA